MPIAWLDQYLLGAREIPLGHCSPCCRIDLLGCCNLKIHLFALPASLCRGLLSNGGSLGWPLASTAAAPWSSLVTWPLWAASPPPRLAPGAGRWGKGREEGKGLGGGKRRDEEKREIDITSHLTFLEKKSLRKLY